jgi:hypothetical protein
MLLDVQLNSRLLVLLSCSLFFCEIYLADHREELLLEAFLCHAEVQYFDPGLDLGTEMGVGEGTDHVQFEVLVALYLRVVEFYVGLISHSKGLFLDYLSDRRVETFFYSLTENQGALHQSWLKLPKISFVTQLDLEEIVTV